MGCFPHSWAALGQGEGVDGKLALFAMELEFEAVLKESLQFCVKKLKIVRRSGRGHLNVETVGSDPVRAAQNLKLLQTVGDLDQGSDVDVAEIEAGSAAGRGGSVGFDGCGGLLRAAE